MGAQASSLALWQQMRREAKKIQTQEPLLSDYLEIAVIRQKTFSDGLGYVLASKLSDDVLDLETLQGLISQIYKSQPQLLTAVLKDLGAIVERDAATHSHLQALLNLKGFQALQIYRITNVLWKRKRTSLAYHLQSKSSEVFAVDIHPAASIGTGIMLDHATGVVIGETAVIGNDVSILHGVTLGGTGKEAGKRHPTIGAGVLLGAGCHVLGNIKIGAGAKVAAGSVVLKNVAPRVTVAGIPAVRICSVKGTPSENMNHNLEE